MDEAKSSGGLSKSRVVLGDLTNRIGKRGFVGREKNEINNSDFSDKDAVKRICVSPSPCTEINSLKGNVISGLSKVADENRKSNESGFGGNFSVSENPTDVDADCDGGLSPKAKSVVMGNSNITEGNNGDKILDLREEDVVSQSVTQLNVDNVDKVSCQNLIGPNLAHLEVGRAVNSISTEADGCGNLDALKENMNLGNVEAVNEIKCSYLENSVTIGCMPGGSKQYSKENDPKMFDLGNDNATIVETHGEPGVSFLADTSRTLIECGNDCPDSVKTCDAGEVNVSQSDARYYHNDMDDDNADNFVLSQSGSIDCPIQSESLKEDECAYMSVKDCSCSFCTKAAYMWSDLNYQDMKARLSVMKKSQKDASILAERSLRIKVTEKNGAESSNRVSKMESHLMYQWRSLFQRTAELWEREGNQLEASLLPLAELREKCATDLESINTKRTENR